MFKVRLPKMTEAFTLLRLAATPAVRRQLKAALVDPAVLEASRSWLTNLQDLLRYFIPVVRKQLCFYCKQDDCSYAHHGISVFCVVEGR